MQIEGDIEHLGFKPAELRAVLDRIEKLNAAPGTPLADKLTVKRSLSGGRSGCEVLDVVLETGRQQAGRARTRHVVKVGPLQELLSELRNWEALRESTPSQHFVPIVAVTGGLTGDTGQSPPDSLQAIVYDHVAAFAGNVDAKVRTLEEVAAAVIAGKGEVTEVTVPLKALFEAVCRTLYGAFEVREGRLAEVFALRLGSQAVLEVDRVDGSVLRDGRPLDPPAVAWGEVMPYDVAQAADRAADATLPKRKDRIRVEDLQLVRRNKRVFLERPSGEDAVRIEVVTPDGNEPTFVDKLKSRDSVGVEGRVRALRREERQERLMATLGDGFALEGGLLRGPEEVRVRDPFEPMWDVLRPASAPFRLVSRAHGDLNPNNVLIVGPTETAPHGAPCLIDFAHTVKGEPLLLDFARLEGLLARTCLPVDFSWAEHVRLQRLLSIVSEFGTKAVEPLAARLGSARPELVRAFRVLAAVRTAARASYPEEHLAKFARDHLEQIFLFAHLSLKWQVDEGPKVAAARATAAMAGVAAEALSGRERFHLWPRKELLGEGAIVAELAASARPEPPLDVTAALVRSLDRLDPKAARGESVLSYLEVARRRIAAARNAASIRAREEARQNDLPEGSFIHLSVQVYADQEAMAAGQKDMAARSTLDGEDVLAVLKREPRLVLLGDSGGGKSTVARWWEDQLATPLFTARVNDTPVFVPEHLDAEVVRDGLRRASPQDDAEKIAAHVGLIPNLLVLGAIHLTVDGLNQIPGDRERVIDWLKDFEVKFPRTRILVCHRFEENLPGLPLFPMAVLKKPSFDEAEKYFSESLAARGLPNHVERARHLVELSDVELTPQLLWMMGKCFGEKGEPPSGRGALFRAFVRWYLTDHVCATTKEAPPADSEIDEREEALALIGFEIVERRETTMNESAARDLLKKAGKEAALEAVIRSGMLARDGEHIRFFHQAFQEYFAARHFFEEKVKDEAALKERVSSDGWSDLFLMVLGFADDAPAAAARALDAAMDANLLEATARCLAKRELSDSALVKRFVARQAATLRDAGADSDARGDAILALAEYGHEPASAELRRLALDSGAPEIERRQALRSLADLFSKPRFKSLAEAMREPLAEVVERLLEEDAAESLTTLAIDTVRDAQLLQLLLYVKQKLEQGSFVVRDTAMRAFETLKIKPTSQQRRSWADAASARLNQVEAEIDAAMTPVKDKHVRGKQDPVERLLELHNERERALKALVDVDGTKCLPMLLERRFSPGNPDQIRRLINKAVEARSTATPRTPEVVTLLEILSKPGEDEGAVDEWIKLLRSGADLEAAAAAHKLIENAARVEPQHLTSLKVGLPPQRSVLGESVTLASVLES